MRGCHNRFGMRLAITGGPGEGKSTVLSMLAELGVPTASADALAREVLEQEDVKEQISEALGLPASFSREELREVMLAEPGSRAVLNRITHPRILERMDAVSHGAIEVPLLVEACLQSDFDRVATVTCGPVEQLARLERRLGDESAARSLIASQLPTRVKIAFSDRIIRTDCALSLVSSNVASLARDFGLA